MTLSTSFNEIPVLSISVSIGVTPVNGATLPWYNGSTTSPKPYQWTATLTVTSQHQSSGITRQALQYNGEDINVGQWIANLSSGLAWQIVSISSKTTTSVSCTLQDVFRYNTYRNPSQNGNGSPITGSYVVFELSEGGEPLIDPAPPGIGTNFLSTLITRFSYINLGQFDFPLSQPGDTVVTFQYGDILATDQPSGSFVLADSTHPNIVGRVTAVDDTGTVFAVDPIRKVIDSFNSLPGTVGDFIYIDNSHPGKLTTTAGGSAVYLQIRNYTQSTTTSGTFSGPLAPVTTAGYTFLVNGVLATVGGTGTFTDVLNAINSTTGTSGVSAVQAGSYYMAITAVDAREIGFSNKVGSAVTDAGLTSVENGIKAAAIAIEQLVQPPTTQIVADLPALNALVVPAGAQVYVINSDDGNGNNVGQWSTWIYNGSAWEETANQRNTPTVAAKTLEYVLTFGSPSSYNIGTVSTGGRTALITVDVTIPFNGAFPTLDIGYSVNGAGGPIVSNNGLMPNSLIDLTNLSVPAIYAASSDILFGTDIAQGDVTIVANYVSNGSTAGSAKIVVSYV